MTHTMTPGAKLEFSLTMAGFYASHRNEATMTMARQTPNKPAWEAGTTMVWVSIAHDDGDQVTVIEFEGHLLEANRTVFSRATEENIHRIEAYILSLTD